MCLFHSSADVAAHLTRFIRGVAATTAKPVLDEVKPLREEVKLGTECMYELFIPLEVVNLSHYLSLVCALPFDFSSITKI